MSSQPSELEELRRQIDELDGQLLELLASRMSKVGDIGEYKRSHGLSPLDEERWQDVVKTRLETAKKVGLPEALVAKLYELIHQYALRIETGEK